MSEQPREPKISKETFKESFRPALYRWAWGGVFTVILGTLLFIFRNLYDPADWTKYALGGSLMLLLCGIAWLVLAYSYRQRLINEGMQPEHSFFAELFYGTLENNIIPREIVAQGAAIQTIPTKQDLTIDTLKQALHQNP